MGWGMFFTPAGAVSVLRSEPFVSGARFGVVSSTMRERSVKRDFLALPWTLLFITACFYSSRAVTPGDPGGVGTGPWFGVRVMPGPGLSPWDTGM